MPNPKILAVWGAPHAGKTVFATKFAESIYQMCGRAVILLYTDIFTPTLPVIFPNRKSADLFSVGTVLSQTEIGANDVVSNLVTGKERADFGYLGYRAGENSYSFPAYTEQKAQNLLSILCEVAEYIVVDCMSHPQNSLLSTAAMKQAGALIRMCAPDLSCMSFYQSQMPAMISTGMLPEKQVAVMNIPCADFGRLSEDAEAHLGVMKQTIPYSQAVRTQYLEGTLSQPTKDRKYMQAVRNIVQAVTV